MAALGQLLEKTSRTFALAIPLLPEPTQTDVGLAYLVLRIADTLEDADNLTTEEQIASLHEFASLLENPDVSRAFKFAQEWAVRQPSANPAYQELLERTPQVISHLLLRDQWVQSLILRETRRTVIGMCRFLAAGDRELRSLADLRLYCYYAAGIVGELLTEIFVRRIPLRSSRAELFSDARAFGEGLQLVNIVKDADDDDRCGRRFLPVDLDHDVVFDLARSDLRRAQQYVYELRRSHAPKGYLAFTELPLRLAWATLDRVAKHGPGSKVPRSDVERLLAELAIP